MEISNKTYLERTQVNVDLLAIIGIRVDYLRTSGRRFELGDFVLTLGNLLTLQYDARAE